MKARPLLKDRRKFSQIADPMLQGQYPMRGLYQALAVAAMCVQEQPNMRPVIADVVTALTYLASQKYDPETQPVQSWRWSPSTPPRTKRDDDKRHNGSGGGSERPRTRRMLWKCPVLVNTAVFPSHVRDRVVCCEGAMRQCSNPMKTQHLCRQLHVLHVGPCWTRFMSLLVFGMNAWNSQSKQLFSAHALIGCSDLWRLKLMSRVQHLFICNLQRLRYFPTLQCLLLLK